jgi:hypothetical protein
MSAEAHTAAAKNDFMEELLPAMDASMRRR